MKPSSKPHIWEQLSNSKLLHFLLLFACGWAIIQAIDYFYSVIVIFTIAAILAALLNFPASWLARYIPRSLAIAIVFLAAVAIFLAVVMVLGLEALNQGQGLLQKLTNSLENIDLLPVREFLEQLEFQRIIEALRTGLLSGLTIAQSLFSGVFLLIFLAVISLYMLIDGARVWRICLKLVPESSRERFSTVFQRSFLGFIRGQILLMIFLSTMSFLVFSILGIPYALFLALVVGILDAIPGIGATLGVLVVSLLVFASQGLGATIQVIIASVILQQIQDNIIHPKVMGDALEISPVFVFLALFIGNQVAGLLGIFLAIPIAGMIAAWFKTDSHPEPPEENLDSSYKSA
jgi:predicted PurR-regulated permease PerM